MTVFRTLLTAAMTTALLTGGAAAQDLSAAARTRPQEEFVCRLAGAADRRIGIYHPDGPRRCRVDYTRDGRTRSLWSAGRDYQFCVRKALEVVALLESVDFKCSPRAAAR